LRRPQSCDIRRTETGGSGRRLGGAGDVAGGRRSGWTSPEASGGGSRPNWAKADSAYDLADDLLELNQPVPAEKYLRQVVTIRKNPLPPGHPAIAESVAALAHALDAQNRPDKAEPFYRESAGLYRKLNPVGNAHSVRAIADLARFLNARHNEAEAETLYRECLTIETRMGCRKSSACARVAESLAELLDSCGRADECRQVRAEYGPASLEPATTAPVTH
jgi:tetratricopeptide (TPR) repeat protein